MLPVRRGETKATTGSSGWSWLEHAVDLWAVVALVLILAGAVLGFLYVVGRFLPEHRVRIVARMGRAIGFTVKLRRDAREIETPRAPDA